MTRTLKRLVVLAVAAGVVVVGATFVYINFIREDAPPRLTLEAASDSSTTTEAGTAADTGDVSGTWTATTGSQAGYRVDEILFGQDSTAVGRTDDVTGTLVIDGTTVTTAKIEVDLTTVESDQDRRDAQFQGRIMDTAMYPTATFELTKAIALDDVPANDETITVKATGKVTLHGTTKEVTVDLSARRTNGTIKVQGSIPIVFADYAIPNPSFGPISTEDHGELEFLVAFAKA